MGGEGGVAAELVIFDCDGVLVDSEVIYVEVERSMLADAGLPIERERYVRTYSAMPGAEWQAKLNEEFRQRTGAAAEDALFDRIRAQCKRGFEADLAQVPGARAALDVMDIPLCVASSSTEDELHWKLRHTGLHDLFDPHIFSTERVQNGKPAPDLFLHAARAMSVDPRNAIVIEDSVNGVAAGKAAGMKVIGFVAGGHCRNGHDEMLTTHGADLTVASFAALAGAIRDLATTKPVI
ncbi:hypothetical protein MNBD_ALPHA09-483 [hydrothermal vent metagenome]|uniref:Phosphatase YieH n=1 Tax=hydrothermal vent metagenome TaxID=652676 RepID=A0A3B0TMP3_9ZZZZ